MPYDKLQKISVYEKSKEEPYRILDTINGFHNRLVVLPTTASDNFLHRFNAPAVEYEDGGYEWWSGGILHRDDGPAIYYPETNEEFFYIYGKRINKNDFYSFTELDSESFLLANQEIIKAKEQQFTGWVFVNNHKVHLKDGRIHSEDGPAVIYSDGSKAWFQFNTLSRDDGPAIIWANGQMEFFVDGERMRPDGLGPVIVDGDGHAIEWRLSGRKVSQKQYFNFIEDLSHKLETDIIADDKKIIWVKNGLAHKPDRPSVIWFNGDREWYLEGKLNNDDGPAVIRTNGHREWHKEGKLHRDNGPALISAIGAQMWYKNGLRHRLDGPAVEFPSGRKAWYIDGVRIKRSQFADRAKEIKEREELVKVVESLLEQISVQNTAIVNAGDDIRQEKEIDELLNKLTEVDGVFDKILNINIDLSEIDLGPADKVHNIVVRKSLDKEVKKSNNGTDMGWALPIISLFGSALLSLNKVSKKKKLQQKLKQQTMQVLEEQQVIQEITV